MRFLSLLLIQQLIHYLPAIAKICALDPLEGLGQIKKSASRRQVKHPERTDHANALLACFPHPLAVVQQEKVSAEEAA